MSRMIIRNASARKAMAVRASYAMAIVRIVFCRSAAYDPLMTVTGIDTLEVVKELKAAGFSEEQAEAVTRVVRRAQDISQSGLANKPDSTRMEARPKARIGALRTEIDVIESCVEAKIAAAKAELMKWILGVAMAVQTVVIIGALVALMRAVSR